jgi:hypothetical protein
VWSQLEDVTLAPPKTSMLNSSSLAMGYPDLSVSDWISYHHKTI